MPQPTYASDTRPFTAKTLNQLFLEAVDTFGDAPAFGRILPSLEVA
jgi:hypothetical protein